MAGQNVFMQVVEKSTNYKEGKSRLELFETDIKDTVRGIKDAATPTLSTVITGDFISTGLLGDIKTKQEEFTTTSSDFDDYIADIQALADTDPRADLTPYTTWTYTYSAIVAADIAADEPVTYEILRQIMNNEGYFHERRINIMLMLLAIRVLATSDSYYNFRYHTPAARAALNAIDDDDLILDDLITFAEGGTMAQIPLILEDGAAIGYDLASIDLVLSLVWKQSAPAGDASIAVQIGTETKTLAIDETTTPEFEKIYRGYFTFTSKSSTDTVTITFANTSSEEFTGFEIQAVGTYE